MLQYFRIVAVCSLFLILFGCNQIADVELTEKQGRFKTEEVGTTAANASDQSYSSDQITGRYSPSMTDVCHYDDDTNAYKLLSLPINAAEAHMELHSDGIPGDAVPGSEEYVFGEECEFEFASPFICEADYDDAVPDISVIGRLKSPSYGSVDFPSPDVIDGGDGVYETFIDANNLLPIEEEGIVVGWKVDFPFFGDVSTDDSIIVSYGTSVGSYTCGPYLVAEFVD